MYFYDSLNEIKHFLAFNFQGFREKMKYKKTIILLALVVFLLSIAGVSASEIDNTIASENANTIELSTDNDIIEDNLQTRVRIQLHILIWPMKLTSQETLN